MKEEKKRRSKDADVEYYNEDEIEDNLQKQ